MNISDNLTLKIEDLAFGGSGVGRSSTGQVVFVPFTAIGDEVEVKVTAVHKSYAEAQVTHLLETGPGRVQPRCPYYGTCGGCCYQHLEYNRELDAKVKQLHDLLKRVGKFATVPEIEPVVRSPQLYGYRNKITLHPIVSETSGKVSSYGFYQFDNETLFPVLVCPLAYPEINDALHELQKPEKIAAIKNEELLSLTIRCAANGKLHFFTGRGRPHPLISECLFPQRLGNPADEPAGNQKAIQFYGCDEASKNEVQVPLNSFWQVNPLAAGQVFALIRDWAEHNHSRDLIDAYAGAGPFSLVLGDLFEKTILVETDAQALTAAVENHRRLGLKKPHVFPKRTEQVLPKLLAQQGRKLSETTVILDPPRGGCNKAVLNALIAHCPARVIYVSCNASTLARDSRLLQKAGLSLIKLALVDMFPRTSHFETVALFE